MFFWWHLGHFQWSHPFFSGVAELCKKGKSEGRRTELCNVKKQFRCILYKICHNFKCSMKVLRSIHYYCTYITYVETAIRLIKISRNTKKVNHIKWAYYKRIKIRMLSSIFILGRQSHIKKIWSTTDPFLGGIESEEGGNGQGGKKRGHQV